MPMLQPTPRLDIFQFMVSVRILLKKRHGIKELWIISYSLIFSFVFEMALMNMENKIIMRLFYK